jgi:hypothetical protein
MGVKKFITWIMSNHSDARGEIKGVFADGDHVILHSHWHGLSDKPRGEAVVEPHLRSHASPRRWRKCPKSGPICRDQDSSPMAPQADHSHLIPDVRICLRARASEQFFKRDRQRIPIRMPDVLSGTSIR